MGWSRVGLSKFLNRSRSLVTSPWSTVEFDTAEYNEFARASMEAETRAGVRTLAALFLLPMIGTALFAPQLGLERTYSYGFLALAALAIHIHISSRAVCEIEALYLLGMVLLVVSATTFVLIAHRTGAIGSVLFASVGLLFMAIPAVPWGLREGSIAAAMIYGLFTVSIWSVTERFPSETLWSLQLYMAAAAVVSTTLVARTALVRKHDLVVRCDLEGARNSLEMLSLQDPLTGVWNRRHLEAEFETISRGDEGKSEDVFLALVDLDDFKSSNDRFGHLYGDRVLCWVARALEVSVLEGGFVSRIGGDEFACVVVGEDGPARMEQAVQALTENFRNAGELDRESPTISIGLVRLPVDRDCTIDEAYKAADNALYECKRAKTSASESSSIVSLDLRGPRVAERPH